MSRVVSQRVRAWILPLAGLGLILYANFRIGTVCGCEGSSPWLFYGLSIRQEPNSISNARELLILALGVQIWLSLLITSNAYVKIGIVVCIVVILIAPDMSLLANNKLHPFSPGQWRDALTSRTTRVAMLDFLALFVNLATALYRSNAYILSKI